MVVRVVPVEAGGMSVKLTEMEGVVVSESGCYYE